METKTTVPFNGMLPNTDGKITPEVAKAMIDFAITHYRNDNPRIQSITARKNGYNGKVSNEKRASVEKIKGVHDTNAKFTSYRLARSKIDLRIGEWLKEPLNTTVHTTNDSQQKVKNRLQNIHKGLNDLKDEVQKLRDNKISNPYNGMQPLPLDEKGMVKDEAMLTNEIIMQRLLNDFIDRDNLKMKLYSNRLEMLLASETYGRVQLGANGVCYEPIDTRHRMVMESDLDPFCDNSPYSGEYKPMFLHQILTNYELEPDDVALLKAVETSSESRSQWKDYYFRPETASKGQYDTYTIQFYSYEPWSVHKVRKNEETGEEYRDEITTDYYQKFKKSIRSDVKKKKYSLDIKKKEYLWEQTRIGPNIYTKPRKVENIVGSWNDPYKTQSDYISMVFNRVDGDSVSFYDLLDAIDYQYDMVRYMINRELYKFKGTALVYDRAYLPKITQINQKDPYAEILAKIINDGVVDINSAAAGMNFDPTKRDKTGIDVKDLGLSKSMPMLLEIGYSLEHAADVLTGLNAERTGQTKPSATATNSSNNLLASRSVTAPLDYFFDRFIERVLNSAMDRFKIYYGIDNPEEGSRITGYPVEVVKRIAKDDFRTKIADARRDEFIRGIMREWLPQAVNAGENTVDAAVEAQTKETIAESILILRKNSMELKKIQAEQAAIKGNQQSQVVAQQSAANKALMDQETENKAKLIVLQGEVDKGVSDRDAINTFVQNKAMFEHENELEQKLAEQEN